MKESYSEDLASHAGPESCMVNREGGREALTGVCAGRVLSPEMIVLGGADAVPSCGRQHAVRRYGETCRDLPGSETSSMHRNTSRENREIPYLSVSMAHGPRWEVSGRNPAMYGDGKSDRCIVPTKPPNNDGRRGRRDDGGP